MRFLPSLMFLFLASTSFAQLKHPKSSPAATVTQEVGFTTITVEYSRPAARGRKIFGDLVPYGRIWRVGANASTKITFDADVQIMGDVLSMGTYALYAFPEKNEWQIVFHANTTHWGDGREKYNSNEDALRIQVKPVYEKNFQENFSISFDQISHDNANMIWQWANTSIIIPIHLDTHRMMEEQISKALQSEPSAQTYYEAARYYVEEKIKYPTALKYLNKAIELGGDTYYFHRVKSLAEAALKDYKSAVASARKSLTIAQKLGKDEFVRMNQKNINSWKSESQD